MISKERNAPPYPM